jgi:hypothetical protein
MLAAGAAPASPPQPRLNGSHHPLDTDARGYGPF